MAKKMILMDPRWLDSLKPTSVYTPPDPLTENMRALDQQMKQILDRVDLPERDKISLYQQTLHRYMHRLDQYKSRPLGLVDVKPPPTLEPVHKETVIEKTPNLPPSKSQEEEEQATTPRIEGARKSYKLRGRKIKSKIPTPKWERWSKQ